MSAKNLLSMGSCRPHIASGTIAAAGVTGAAIVEPGRSGVREVTLILASDVPAAVTTGFVQVQGRLRVGATWETLQKRDGSGDLETIDQTIFDVDGPLGAGDCLYATFPLQFLDPERYDAMRFRVVSPKGAGFELLNAHALVFLGSPNAVPYVQENDAILPALHTFAAFTG